MDYNRNYRGIIVQNDDPEEMGRVKVFVPSVNMTLYENWNKEKKDKKFTKFGANLNEEGDGITPEIMSKLADSLPWAIVQQPIFGGGNAVNFHRDIDYSEKSNDSDNSIQHTFTNKELPPNNNTDKPSLEDRLAHENAIPSENSSEKSEDSSNDWIKNIVSSDEATKTSNNAAAEEEAETSNVGGITITHISKNIQNLRGRKFFSTSSIETGNQKFNQYYDITNNRMRNSYIGIDGNIVNVPPLLTYSNPNQSNVPDFTEFVRISPQGVDRYKINSELLLMNNGKIVAKDELDATGKKRSNSFSINVEDIVEINVVPTNSLPINLINGTFNFIANLIQPALVPITPSKNPVLPPFPVPFPMHNAGGGGADMNTLTSSDLLPTNALKNSLSGGSNPNSVSRQNQGTEPDKQTDPNKTKHPNTNHPDKNKHPLRSSTQGNKVKGMVSIPAVGTNVNVFFEQGNINYPIVTGYYFTKEDLRGIHDSSTEKERENSISEKGMFDKIVEAATEANTDIAHSITTKLSKLIYGDWTKPFTEEQLKSFTQKEP